MQGSQQQGRRLLHGKPSKPSFSVKCVSAPSSIDLAHCGSTSQSNCAPIVRSRWGELQWAWYLFERKTWYRNVHLCRSVPATIMCSCQMSARNNVCRSPASVSALWTWHIFRVWRRVHQMPNKLLPAINVKQELTCLTFQELTCLTFQPCSPTCDCSCSPTCDCLARGMLSCPKFH